MGQDLMLSRTATRVLSEVFSRIHILDAVKYEHNALGSILHRAAKPASTACSTSAMPQRLNVQGPLD